MRIPDFEILNFNKGLITQIEDETIAPNAASDSLNWMHLGDHIELRRGYSVLGTDKTGGGRITGLKSAKRFDDTQVLFSTYGQKLQYYNETTGDHVEIDSNLLGSAADGEDVAMDTYFSLAGAMLYASSPNSSFYKVSTSNPTSAVDQLSTNFRGYFRIKQNRTFLWNRKDTNGGSDPTGIFLSYIDRDELSDYTAVSAESVGTGNGTNKTFTGTLAFKAAGSKRTCMFVSVTDGVETFRDNRNGVLTGNLGGTGTINYATGAYSVTFNTAPVNLAAITSDYYWEDATSLGILDFSKSTPRIAGQGAVFRQDEGGGNFQNLGSLGESEYCIHQSKAWKLTISSDDTKATNLIFRNKVGIPNWRAMAETGEGIYYIDTLDKTKPVFRLLTFEQFSSNVIPKSISDVLDLSGYIFTKSVVFEWGAYVCFACQSVDSTFNNTLFTYHRLWNTWDKHDYAVSVLDNYNGTLVAGSSISNNVFQLFDGLSDENANISNFWVSGKTNLKVSGLKIANRLLVSGLIGIDQSIDVSLSYDGGSFVKTFTILGNGAYVAVGAQVTIGSSVLGENPIGGSGITSTIQASPYELDAFIGSPSFEFVKVKFEATNIGYASVSRFTYKDIRAKGRKIQDVNTIG